MLSKTHIEEITAQAAREQWDYPTTLSALKEAGVDHYETKVATHEITYYRGKKNITCDAPHEASRLVIAKEFNADQLKVVLKEHQTQKTSYADFLKAIAAAGVVSYKVDVTKRSVSYLGAKPGQEYMEMVPAAKKTKPS